MKIVAGLFWVGVVLVLLVSLLDSNGAAHSQSTAFGGDANQSGKLYVAHFDGCTTDMFGFPHISGTAVNDTGHDLSYAQITLRLLDASGAQVGSALANTAGLQANGKWRFEAMGACKGVVRYEVANITSD